MNIFDGQPRAIWDAKGNANDKTVIRLRTRLGKMLLIIKCKGRRASTKL